MLITSLQVQDSESNQNCPTKYPCPRTDRRPLGYRWRIWMQ